MTPDEKRRLLTLVSSSLSPQAVNGKDPLLGLMADEPELMDQVVEAAYEGLERHPLRLPSNG